MTWDTVLHISMGIALIGLGILYHYTSKELKLVTAEKIAVEQQYKSEKANWLSQLEQQNKLVESMKADEESLTANTKTKLDELGKTLEGKQEQLRIELSKDGSNDNILDKTNELLHSFSNNR